jgi:hypothetical protein
MGDSWDDEEFDVKLPVAATSWEDEVRFYGRNAPGAGLRHRRGA